MMWNDVIYLLDTQFIENDIGDIVENSTAKMVFANKKSVRQSEFYQAMNHGLKPELMFETYLLNYSGETQVTHNGKVYQIIRTFSKNEETIELICTGLAVG